MKKILIGLIAISCSLTFASSKLITAELEDIEEPTKPLPYESKYINDDGSITIVRPIFPDPRRSGYRRISVEDDSNLEGVCKYLGESAYAPKSARYVDAPNWTNLIRLSSDGTFLRYESAHHKNALESLICLPSVETPKSPSKNAEYITRNDDGSITIVEPMFSNALGTGNLRFSNDDDLNLDGICKLFGEKKYATNSVTYARTTPNSKSLVILSDKGKFERFEFGYRKNQIRSLICLPSKEIQIKPSRNAESITDNNDGSITIFRPLFSDPDGNGNVRISVEDDSNLKGVCKLFGKRIYVPNSAIYEDAQSWTRLARISSNGKFDRFDKNYQKSALKSLSCRD